jgi:hypothetical protein
MARTDLGPSASLNAVARAGRARRITTQIRSHDTHRIGLRVLPGLVCGCGGLVLLADTAAHSPYVES